MKYGKTAVSPRWHDIPDEDIQLASQCEGFERVEAALSEGSQEARDAAGCEIIAAAAFLRSGLTVHFLPKQKKTRSPDLEVQHDDGITYIEVTRLGESSFRRRAIAQADPAIWGHQDFQGVNVKIKLHKFISTLHRAELIEEIAGVAREVKRLRIPKGIEVPGLITVQVESGDKGQSSLSLQGRSFHLAEIERIRRKIEKKAGQLPPGAPGLIIIFDDEIVPKQFEAPDYRPIILELDETVFEFPDLAGVVIAIDDKFGLYSRFPRSGEYWMTCRRGVSTSRQQDIIFIRNRYSPHVLDSRILGTFDLLSVP